MKFVVDPEILLEVVRSHLDLPRDGMPAAITQDLAKGSPGRIETEPESFVSNAGGVMGQVTVLNASIREYLIFFGSPRGGGAVLFAPDYVRENFPGAPRDDGGCDEIPLSGCYGHVRTRAPVCRVGLGSRPRRHTTSSNTPFCCATEMAQHVSNTTVTAKGYSLAGAG